MSNNAELTPKQARRIDQICDRFEMNLKSGSGEKAEAYLNGVEENLQRPLLQELLCLEVAYLRVQGETVEAAAYRDRFPNHLDLIELAINTAGVKTYVRVDLPTDCSTPKDLPYEFGDYLLLDEIARGGMGVIYRARQRTLNRIVAIKMIRAGEFAGKQEVQRFYNEAEAAANLDHPNIVSMYEVGQQAGQHYLSMAYVEGQSLADVQRDGVLAPSIAAEYVKTAAEAIHYAHEQGVLHRDIKPGNVLLDSSGQIRITDFGLAKRLGSDSDLTRDSQVLGTPEYMPPEQARGENDQLGPSADIYALGALLYALLTGRPPFRAENWMTTLQQVTEKEPVTPRRLNPDLDRDLETICLKCLEKDPDQRYESASHLADELGRFLSGQPILVRPVSRAVRVWKWSKRNPLLAKLFALIMILTMASLVSTGWALRTMDTSRLSRKTERRASVENRSFLLPAISEKDATEGAEAMEASSYLQVVHPALRNCKLVFAASTEASVNLESVRQSADELTDAFCGDTRIGFNRGRHGSIVAPIKNDWVSWAAPLTIHWSDNKRDSFLGPKDLSLLLRVAISKGGEIQLGTEGPRTREHLLVLAQLGGVSNTEDFDLQALANSIYKTPHNAIIDTDEKQTLFALWFANLYQSMAKSRIARQGPKNGAELYVCPVRLLNFFDGQPITVVHGHLHHVQFDYEWYPEIRRPIDERMNALWSPIANRPDQDARLTIRCNLAYSGDTTSALHMLASSDNHNATQFRATGMAVGEQPDVLQVGEWTTIELDRGRGICSGGNRDSSGSEAVLYDVAPAQIELSADSTWSVVQPWFRLATFSSVSVEKTEYSPKGEAKRVLQPQVWVIEPE